MAKRKNVLVIMSDQHHAEFMGCAGDELVRTPHLDRLAGEGTRFSQTYCAYPLCGPSRMAFMSSRHCHEVGVWNNSQQLNSGCPTFAHGFAAAGYRTVLSGRMHFVGMDQRHGFHERLMGDVPESAHIDRGWRLKGVLGELSNTTGHGFNSLDRSGPGDSGYLAYDDKVGEVTADWLRARGAEDDEQPFLLVAGLVLPHCPFVSPRELFDYYAARVTMDELPALDADMHPHMKAWHEVSVPQPEPDREAQWRVRAAYYGMCEYMDRVIGEMLTALDEAGLADDTIVVYTSDHGEQLGEHGMWWKSTFYDGASRVPMVVREPGVAGGKVVNENVSLIDIGPTLLDMVGAAPLPKASGRSFAGLVRGDDAEWSDTVWVDLTTCGSAACPAVPCRMVKRGPWKYSYYHGMAGQLFNVEEDPGELVDRVDDPACAELVAELEALVLADWDPEWVISRLDRTGEEAGLVSGYLNQRDDLYEPDEIWYGDEEPANSFERVPYSAYHPD